MSLSYFSCTSCRDSRRPLTSICNDCRSSDISCSLPSISDSASPFEFTCTDLLVGCRGRALDSHGVAGESGETSAPSGSAASADGCSCISSFPSATRPAA